MISELPAHPLFLFFDSSTADGRFSSTRGGADACYLASSRRGRPLTRASVAKAGPQAVSGILAGPQFLVPLLLLRVPSPSSSPISLPVILASVLPNVFLIKRVAWGDSDMATPISPLTFCAQLAQHAWHSLAHSGLYLPPCGGASLNRTPVLFFPQALSLH